METTPRPHSPCRRHVPALVLVICLAFLVTAAAGAAATVPGAVPGTPAVLVQRTIALATTTPEPVTCPVGCTCMELARAAIAWGAEGFTRCNENPCGYNYAVGAMPIAKYCLKQKAAPDIAVRPQVTLTYPGPVIIPVVTTTTKIPVQQVTLLPSGICPGDADCDGRTDAADNCPVMANPEQEDADNDGTGDDCDSCVLAANPGQSDIDSDKVGDACDLCPNDPAPSGQTYIDDMEAPGHADNDDNGIGDRCEKAENLDSDGDGRMNPKDNCPATSNPGQQDTDGYILTCDTGQGYVIPDTSTCQDIAADLGTESPSYLACMNAAWEKANGGKSGEGCLKKSDGKGDACDNCRSVQNTDQNDSDKDCDVLKNTPAYWSASAGWLQDPHCGDACDNCKTVSNPFQENTDGDQYGNACDSCWKKADNQADADGDCELLKSDSAFWSPATGWKKDPHCGDACDNCKAASNPYQEDNDNDLWGNACDDCWNEPDAIQGNYFYPEACNATKTQILFWDGQKWLQDPVCGAQCHDGDFDGFADGRDSCPTRYDPGQWDAETNGFGDACECLYNPNYLGGGKLTADCQADDFVPLRLSGGSEKIDIVLLPDCDYVPFTSKDNLMNEAVNLIRNGWDNTNLVHNGNIFRNLKTYDNKVNFYLSYSCVRVTQKGGFESGMSYNDFEEYYSFADAVGVVVGDGFRCWAGAKEGTSVFTVNHDRPGTMMHELGHAYFWLGDEYCCDTLYENRPNLHDNYQDCTTQAAALGMPAACRVVCTDSSSDPYGGENKCCTFWDFGSCGYYTPDSPHCLMDDGNHHPAPYYYDTACSALVDSVLSANA